MRNVLIYGYILLFAISDIPLALSGDSASMPELQSVGYSPPSSNRAQTADSAERANHANTADRLLNGGNERPKLGIVCGAGKSACPTRALLAPGTYLVNCYSDREGNNAYQVSIVITGASGSGSEWAGCPSPKVGRKGVWQRYITWISRTG